MSEFYTDQPITGADSSPDQLNREDFANRIADGLLLREGSPGLVISLEGDWGSGKTSFINLISKHYQSLPDAEQPIVVHFNPWIFCGAENLVQEFLVHMASSISMHADLPGAQRVARELLQYSKVFAALKYAPGSGPWMSVIESITEQDQSGATAAEQLQSLNINVKRNDVASAFAALNRPLVVFIDDIDRISPDEVFSMLRFVKAVADFPRIAFMLVFDATYVEQALTACKIMDPRSYLEKIVQVHLNLPIVNVGDIDKLVDEELKKLPANVKRDQFVDSTFRLAELYQFAIKHLLRSPRDVKRLINRLYIRALSVAGEVAFSDLVALEAIALKAPSVYEHIRSFPEMYTGYHGDSSVADDSPKAYVQSSDEERIVRIRGLASEYQRPIRLLIDRLFPLTDQHGVHGDQDYYSKRGQIAAIDRLMIALSYGLPSNEIQLSLIKAFLKNKDNRKKILESIINKGKIERFFELLRVTIDEVKVDDQQGFIELLAGLAESSVVASVEKNKNNLLSTNLVKQIWWIVERLLQNRNKLERIGYIKKLLAYPDRLTLATYGLMHCLRQHGYYDASYIAPENEQWCNADELSALKNSWLYKVESVFSSKYFCSLTGKGEIVELLRKIDEDVARELVTGMLATDKDLDCIADALCHLASDSIKGRYAYVDAQLLASIGGGDTIRFRVTKRVKSTTPLTETLIAIYKSIITGKKIYLLDGSEVKSEMK